MRKILLAALAAAVLFCPAARAQYQVVVGPGGGPVPITGTISVASTADLPGNTATFSANNVCTSVLTAGEQSVGFHLDSGTLAATLTAFGTQSIGAVNCASAGSCTSLTFSSGSTIVVTNPNGVKDVGVVVQPGMRQVEICTTSFTSGSATGVVTATYLNATSSGGGGGTVAQGTANTAANAWPVAETFSGSLIDPRSIRALTVADIVGIGAGSAIIGKVGIDQTTPGTTNGVSAAQSGTWSFLGTKTNNAAAPGATNFGALPCLANAAAQTWTEGDLVFCSVDLSGNTRVIVSGTANVQFLGTAGSNSGGVGTFQGIVGGVALPVTTDASTILAVDNADRSATATTLSTSCSTATACAATASIQWPLNGATSAEVVVTAVSSPVGITVACDEGYDGPSGAVTATTYLLAKCTFTRTDSGAYGQPRLTLANGDLAASTSRRLNIQGAASHVRVRISALTSGTFTAAGRATTSPPAREHLGRAVTVANADRSQQTVGTPVAVTTTTETTLLSAGGAGVFLDLTHLHCSNLTSTASQVDVRDSTGGTIRFTYACPAAIGPCEGDDFNMPISQGAANSTWTMKLGTAVGGSGIACTADAVQNR